MSSAIHTAPAITQTCRLPSHQSTKANFALVKVDRPLVQDSSTDSPILAPPARSQATKYIFREDTVEIEPRTFELFAESLTDSAI